MKTISYKVTRKGGQVMTVTIPENHGEATGVNVVGLVITGVLLLGLIGFVCLLFRII